MNIQKHCRAILASLALMALAAGTANATCTLSGYAVRMATVNGSTFLFLRPTFGTNYYYLGLTYDPFVSDALYQAYRGKVRILVQSEIASCPAIGGQGEKFIGEINVVYLGV